MARIRTIKPEFWTHEDLSSLPEATHMLAAALLNHADDEGYFNANPGLVKAACSPLREPSVSIQDSLILLEKAGFIRLGSGPDGKRYGQVVTFDDHQRVNRPTPSKIKVAGVVWESSDTTHTQLSEDSPPERKGREQGKEEEGKGVSSLRSDSSASLTLTNVDPPADLKERKSARLKQVAEEAQAAYNRILAKPEGLLSQCAVLNKPRMKAVEKAIDTAKLVCQQLYGNQRITPQFWQDYFDQAAQDDFLGGRGPYTGTHEKWRPDFEYLLREEVMARVIDKGFSEAAA